MASIQSIRFDRKIFPTTHAARRWLKEHGKRPTKRAHTTARYYRYRLKEPNSDIYYYRPRILTKGVVGVIEWKKRKLNI